jgi:hypothetical protein
VSFWEQKWENPGIRKSNGNVKNGKKMQVINGSKIVIDGYGLT